MGRHEHDKDEPREVPTPEPVIARAAGPQVSRIEAKLPTGRTIRIREPRGSDELAATAEAGDDPKRAAILLDRGLIMRCIVSLDGAPWEKDRVTVHSVRDLFTAKEWVALRELFYDIYMPSEEERADTRASKRIVGA